MIKGEKSVFKISFMKINKTKNEKNQKKFKNRTKEKRNG